MVSGSSLSLRTGRPYSHNCWVSQECPTTGIGNLWWPVGVTGINLLCPNIILIYFVLILPGSSTRINTKSRFMKSWDFIFFSYVGPNLAWTLTNFHKQENWSHFTQIFVNSLKHLITYTNKLWNHPSQFWKGIKLINKYFRLIHFSFGAFQRTLKRIDQKIPQSKIILHEC